MADARPGSSVVLGTGPLGLALAGELASRGQRVRLVNRSGRLPDGQVALAHVVRADVADPAGLEAACAGAQVVFHCLGLPYAQWHRFPHLMRNVIECATRTGARVVYGDNVYAYGVVDGPVHEGLAETAATAKGRIRAEVAGLLMQAHREGRVPAAIARGSDFFGPGVTEASMLGSRVFGRLVAGKPAQVVGDPDRLHSYTYIRDFARTLAELAAREEALGAVWHVPNAPAQTTRAIVQLIGARLGTPARISVLPRWMLAVAGLFDANARELREMLYEFEADFVVEGDRARSTFGLQATPLDQAVAETLEWWHKQGAAAG